jgi:hypothetical protein|tara:strand:+ start:273 stop:533 length:261 start_codon:yes stop_codon:yes gene_type:complete
LNWRWRLIVVIIGVRRTCRFVGVIPRPNVRIVGIDEVAVVGVVTVNDSVVVTVTCRTIKNAVTICVRVLPVRDAVTVGVRVIGVGV